MNIQDINGWKYGFLKRNESQCVEYLLVLQDLALESIEDGNWKEASALYQKIASGAEKLSKLDKETYEPSLYAAFFLAAKIEAFRLEDRKEAIRLLRNACGLARKCASYSRPDFEIAEQDLEMMQKLLLKLEKGVPLTALKSGTEEDAWNLTKEEILSGIKVDNTISGLGCLAVIFVFIVLFVLYSYVGTTTSGAM